MVSYADKFSVALRAVVAIADSPVASIHQQVRVLRKLCMHVLYRVDDEFKEYRWQLRKFFAGHNTIKFLLAVEKICTILYKTFKKTYKCYHPGDWNFLEQMIYLRKGLLFICLEYYTPNKFNVSCEAERKWLLHLQKRLCWRLKRLRLIVKTAFVMKDKSVFKFTPYGSLEMTRTVDDIHRKPPLKYLLREGSSLSDLPAILTDKFQDHSHEDDFFKAQQSAYCAYCNETYFFNESENFIILGNCPHLYCTRCFYFLLENMESRCCVGTCSRPFLTYSDRISFSFYKLLSASEKR